MDGAVGTWDFDTETETLTFGPRAVLPVTVDFAEGGARRDSLLDWVHTDDRGGLDDALADCLSGRTPALRHRFRVGPGQHGWTWVEVTGRRDESGRRLSGVWADVTQALLAAARKDEAVARVHQFAAAASHDLIGPLRHIAMYGDLLLGDFGTGATQEKRKMLEAIAEKARALQILTKRLIAFSTDPTATEQVAVPLERAVASVRRRLADEISGVGAIVTVGPLPVAHGDPVLIEKVFENLLRNALEWRTERRIEVAIRARPERGSVVVTVSDNGPGIDERYAGRIFDAFWSLPRPGGQKGAGLGLAACKTLVAALGGDIRLSSTSPEGTAFEVVFPRWL